ncbi:uncharacterized protein LOC127879354 [Dreissena polymorpha]|uniref:uncharacterized protein LOC127879354 n=1 Tax=Dreissena polymorpha TaxID=45954 RepID=UPI002264E52F|nr:uncharacterized protein LOC127879354 [Dreissena polymorpha]
MWKYSTVSTKLVRVLVIVFLYGPIPLISASGLCFVLETNQTLQQYCEWSNWFPWNCVICGLGVPGNLSLASRTRSICCDKRLPPETCGTSCNVIQNDVKETGICETECPHLYNTTAKASLPSAKVEAQTLPSTPTVTSKSDYNEYTSPSTTLRSDIQTTSTLPLLVRSSTTKVVENSAGHGDSSYLRAVAHTQGMSCDDQCCYLGSWMLYSRGSLRLCLFILMSFYVTIATTGFLATLRIVRVYNNRKSRVHTSAKPPFNDSV